MHLGWDWWYFRVSEGRKTGIERVKIYTKLWSYMEEFAQILPEMEGHWSAQVWQVRLEMNTNLYRQISDEGIEPEMSGSTLCYTQLDLWNAQFIFFTDSKDTNFEHKKEIIGRVSCNSIQIERKKGGWQSTLIFSKIGLLLWKNFGVDL